MLHDVVLAENLRKQILSNPEMIRFFGLSECDLVRTRFSFFNLFVPNPND
jgi:hypothetical protein